jgi:hypothetical protein
MATTVQAAPIEVTPSLTLHERYTWQTEGHTVATFLSPAFNVRKVGDASLTQIHYQLSFQKRHGEADAGSDTELDHHLTFSRQAEWTRRLKTAWDGFLIVSPDLTRFSTETVMDQAESVLIPGADTVQSGLRFHTFYESTPTHTFQVGLSLNDTRYRSPSLNDAIGYGLSLSHVAQVTHADQARFSYGFTQNRIEKEKSDIHHLGMGYSRSLYPTLFVHLSAGGGYATEVDILTTTFGAGLSRVVDQQTLHLTASRNLAGANRDVAVSSNVNTRAGGGLFSEPTVTESLSLKTSGPILQHLTGHFQATAARNQTLSTGNDPITTYTAVTGVQYAFNAYWSGGITYQYLDQRAGDVIPEDPFHTHSVSVALTWRGSSWK